MIKVLLISSGQPALNPRLVKEADALIKAGYNVTVIYTYWNDWGFQLTKTLLLTKKWEAVCAGGSPIENPFVYFISRLIQKFTKWAFINLHLNSLAGSAVSRVTLFFIKEAKKHKADIYIGHNLGALPATVKAARKYKAKCGFDAEDLHRYEVSDDTNSFNYKAVKYLEDKYYPGLDYLTTSSPQIASAYQNTYPQKKLVTILNAFSASINTKRYINNTGCIKLFWFSQTVGINRGLDDIAKALKALNSDNFELHLLGHLNNDSKLGFVENELAGISNVYFHDPIPPDDLINFAAQFDIGLALEPGFSTNNNLALSNKLFTYLQAGLVIIASDTIAQENFINENPAVGKIYPKKNISALADILLAYQTNRELLFSTCKASLAIGHEKLNWENESVKFLSLINQTLDKN